MAFRISRAWCLAVIGWLVAHTAVATGPQYALAADADIDDLLRFAAENSPELRAAFEEWQGAVERIPQAGALPDPELTYGYFVERMNMRQRLSVSQMFPAWGKRGLRADRAEYGADAARERLESARLRVMGSVREAYAEYAYVGESVDLLRELSDLLEEWYEVALTRFRSGEIGNPELLRIEMEKERIDDDRVSMQAMQEPAAAALNAALGRPHNAPLPEPSLQPAEILDTVAQDRIERLDEVNPALRARSREIEQAQAGIELARREGRPDFMLGIEFMDNSGPAPDEVMAMAGINLPIWRENYAAGRREARAARNAAIARRESEAHQLEAQLQMIHYRIRDAERKMRLYGESLRPRAEEAYASLSAGYRSGDADFLELLDAQRSLLDVELSYLRAVADHRQQLARWQRLTGGDLPGQGILFKEEAFDERK